MKKFTQNDWNFMHDCILGATWQTTKTSCTQEELESIYEKLPEELKGEAIEWGMSDTLWREHFIDWYKKNNKI